MSRTAQLAPFLFTAVLLALFAAQGCSTTSKGADTATLTRTATAPPAPLSTATRTFTNTPIPTNTPLFSPTSTPCGTAACTPPAFFGYPPAGGFTIYPSPTPQLIGTLNIVCGSWWRFYFCATAGLTYHFSVCSNGGSFLNDTVFGLYDGSCALQAYNDDTCGLGSEIVWLATYSGQALLTVRNATWANETFNVAYWAL